MDTNFSSHKLYKSQDYPFLFFSVNFNFFNYSCYLIFYILHISSILWINKIRKNNLLFINTFDEGIPIKNRKQVVSFLYIYYNFVVECIVIFLNYVVWNLKYMKKLLLLYSWVYITDSHYNIKFCHYNLYFVTNWV